jgi:hypothetical protein
VAGGEGDNGGGGGGEGVVFEVAELEFPGGGATQAVPPTDKMSKMPSPAERKIRFILITPFLEVVASDLIRYLRSSG